MMLLLDEDDDDDDGIHTVECLADSMATHFPSPFLSAPVAGGRTRLRPAGECVPHDRHVRRSDERHRVDGTMKFGS